MNMKNNLSKFMAGVVTAVLLSVSSPANAACFMQYRYLTIKNGGGNGADKLYFKDPYMQDGDEGSWWEADTSNASDPQMRDAGEKFLNYASVYTVAGSCSIRWKVKISCSRSSGYVEATMGSTTEDNTVTVSAECSDGTVSNVGWTTSNQ